MSHVVKIISRSELLSSSLEFSAPEIYMAISWMIVLLQVVAGTISSFLVGMIWFSSYGLGRIWWSYTFPNKKYGECTGPAEGPLHLLSTGCYAIQSVVISFIINTLLSTPAFLPVDLHSLPLPLLCSSLISIVVACMAYPHYIYSGKSTVLFLINVSYDAVQVTIGTLAIYSLALGFN